jgi:hypothetical protein
MLVTVLGMATVLTPLVPHKQKGPMPMTGRPLITLGMLTEPPGPE